MRLGLDDAGAGDQEKLARAHVDRTDFEGVAHAIDCTGLRQPEAVPAPAEDLNFLRLGIYELNAPSDFAAKTAKCARTRLKPRPDTFDCQQIVR
jgi:hypothetical protein